jgi:hypothetical protein
MSLASLAMVFLALRILCLQVVDQPRKLFPHSLDLALQLDAHGVELNSPQQIGKLTFQQIAYHYMHPEIGELRDLCDGSQETSKGNVRHCIDRWGDTPAVNIRVLEVESWLKSLAQENGGKCEWSTVGKIRDAMSVVYQHAQRHELGLPHRDSGALHRPSTLRPPFHFLVSNTPDLTHQ